MSFILSSAGFVPNVEQTTQSLSTISFCYVGLPAITLVIYIILMLLYKVDYIKIHTLNKEK